MADLEKPSLAVDDEDVRHDDLEYDVRLEPKNSKAWLNLLRESEKAFEYWNARCDNIDKLYGDLMQLSATARDRQFQIFWANCEVLKPSIYAKPPVPVVVPKFKDRLPVYQAASELLERATNVAFDLARINDLMLLVRDDVATIGRGVAWCRYESKADAAKEYGGSKNYAYERVCIDFKERRDFLHSLSRNWREVTWVAAASYLTRAEARARFKPFSDDAYQDAEYKVNKDAEEIGGGDNRERAKFWEVWDRPNRRVVWVAEGVDVILDEADPHLNLQDFFPCPKPAYGTVQRGSLVPVPDVMQYQDQLEEVNLLTAKIHAVSEAIELKGFYPAGGSEIADAIQTAVATHTPGRVLVPISNWASFGGSKEVIIWMPIAEAMQTVQGLIQTRQQVIQDIYQIMGLSDIMRGATDPHETLGAQQLKTEYGSTRVRDKQGELVRLARDLVAITAEIICEKFKPETVIMMSQTQLPTPEMQQAKAMQLQGQLQMMAQSMAQMPPEQQGQMQQQMTAIGSELEKISLQPNIYQVLHFLDDNRARAFVLDIETDSTIQADENAEKQRRAEFMGVLAQLLPQLTQMFTAEPNTAEFCGELLKFSTAPFRAGRSLDGAIDQLVELMKLKGSQPRGDDPTTAQNKTALQIEQLKTQQKDKSDEANRQVKMQELQMRDQNEKLRIQNDREIEIMKMQRGQQADQAKAQQTTQKALHDREEHQQKLVESAQDMQLNRQKQEMAQQQLLHKQADMAARQVDRQQAQQFRQQQTLARQTQGPI